MAQYTRSEIISGFFVTLAVAIFAMFSFRILEVDPLAFLRRTPLLCVADLSDATGLKRGAVVSVAGHEVGRVTGVSIATRPVGPDAGGGGEGAGGTAPDADRPTQIARVEFQILHRGLRLDPETASVMLSRNGLLGRVFLALDPGIVTGDKPRAIEMAGGDPVRIHGDDAADMSQLIAQMSSLMTGAKQTVRQVNAILEENRDHLKGVMASADGMLDENRSRVRSMIATADGMLEENRPRVKGMLTTAEGILEENRPGLKSAIRNADELLVENRPRLKALIEDLRSTSRTLEDSIKVVSADTHRLLELTHDVVDENRPEIAETMRRLRRTMWEAEMAMRKIRANPAYLIFGDEEQILNQNPYDTSWIRRSGRAEPFEQRDENVRNVDMP